MLLSSFSLLQTASSETYIIFSRSHLINWRTRKDNWMSWFRVLCPLTHFVVIIKTWLSSTFSLPRLWFTSFPTSQFYRESHFYLVPHFCLRIKNGLNFGFCLEVSTWSGSGALRNSIKINTSKFQWNDHMFQAVFGKVQSFYLNLAISIPVNFIITRLDLYAIVFLPPEHKRFHVFQSSFHQNFLQPREWSANQ